MKRLANSPTWWLLTIKQRKSGYTSVLELHEVLTSLRKRIRGADWISKVSYELDKQGILHIHTLFRRTADIRYGMYQRPGWTIRFDRITPTTLKTVYNYICKDAYNRYEQEQILMTNWYLHHNGFTHDGPAVQEIVPLI